MGKFIHTGVLAAAMLATGCLQGADNVQVDDADESALLGESEDALGFNVILKAKHSGGCLDIAGANTSGGAPLIQWDCHGGGNQRFNFVHTGFGNYNIVMVHSGQCLDVAGANPANVVPILQWPCHGGDHQKFRLLAHPDGYFSFVAVHSGRCLDVKGANPANGVPIIQYDCHLGDNQRFRTY